MRILVQVFSFLIFLSLTTNIHALEHVSLLKKSVQEWNQWRKQNPKVIPNLRGANLQKANLRGAGLQGANLKGAILTEANFQGAYLNEAEFHFTHLQNVNLEGTDLQEAEHLTCNQINSVKSLNKETKFPDNLEVKITGKNKWTGKEVKKENDK